MSSWIRFFFFLVPLLIVAGAVFSIDRSRKQRDKRLAHPLRGRCLRPAGEGLRRRLEEKERDLISLVVAVLGIYLVVSLTALMLKWESPVGRIFWIGLFGGMLINSVFVAIKLRRLSVELSAMYLGFEGERYVGQTLVDELMPYGFRVYHDIVLERNGRKFNVDHVVVGRNGVFAIETKTWRHPKNASGDEERTATLQGDSLILPRPLTEVESDKAFRQARRNAAAIHEELFGKNDESHWVFPVVALPGWKIDIQKYDGVAVIGAWNNRKCFSTFGNSNYSDEVYGMIVARMEQLASMDAHEVFPPPAKR
jgi:hypothetical protein